MFGPFDHAVSLGATCATKYQIARHLFFRLYPTGNLTEFQRVIASPSEAGVHFGTHIFDWQITPPSAVCDYLAADFEGTFERDDLELVSDGNHVRNRRFGTLHPHAFTVNAGRVTTAQIDLEYPAARQKVDYLAEKFRRLLRAASTVLYVFHLWEPATPAYARRLVDLLDAKSRNRRFHVVFLNLGAPADLAGVDDRVSAFAVREAADKPAEFRWQGDDAAWERVLARFRIALPVSDAPAGTAPRPQPQFAGGTN